MRLGKYIAHAGVASRRAAEQLIAEGRVRVNGVPVTDPARAVSDTDAVEFDGRAVSPRAPRHLVYALNKPLGVISTVRDTHGRPTVVELIASDERLYPVGRLDGDTSGLILLTNDGELANLLTHPRYGVTKTYRVGVTRPPVGARAIERLRAGVMLEDGPTLPAEVSRRGSDELEIVLREGRKRQVRRMLEAVGYRVKTLERVRLGTVELGRLRAGDYRRLSAAEVERLRSVSGRR